MTSVVAPTGPPAAPSLRSRLQAFTARHRRIFWMLHSVWALATGTLTAVLAHDRYHLIFWVVGFLVATWASTLFFAGRTVEGDAETETSGSARVRLAQGFTSYLTRVMYQETLFFLIPFYAYSTVVDSPNVLFFALLVGLAVFSCIDLLFDQWLRTRPVFALAFFAVVTFAAMNLLLPLLIGIPLRFVTASAAAIALAAALPLAWKGTKDAPGSGPRLAAAGVALLCVAMGFPAAVPPVPLRLAEASFATSIDPASLELSGPVEGSSLAGTSAAELVVLARVFAPSSVPARVRLEWTRNGQSLRRSREVDIQANENGFRVWDSWKTPTESLPAGNYRVVLSAWGNRVFGVAKLTITD